MRGGRAGTIPRSPDALSQGPGRSACRERSIAKAEANEAITFSEKFACPVSGFTLPEIEPRLFSFNAPQGACPTCNGLGERLFFDPFLIVPNEAVSLKDGAVVPWAKSSPPSP